MRALGQALWPPSAPLLAGADAEERAHWWATLCTLLVVPGTAVLHHVVFFRQNCMMNPFLGTYSDPEALARFFGEDPSLPWAIVACTALYAVGKRWSTVQWITAPAFASSLPFSLWLWDIPFSARFICRHFHDDKLVVAGFTVHTVDFYALSVAAYISFWVVVYRKLCLRRRVPASS